MFHMTVTPYSRNRFQTREELYRFLNHCQKAAQRDQCSKIANFSCEIDQVDPLVALQELGTPETIYFYFENGHQQEAIAAIGTAAHQKLYGAQRFVAAQGFMEACGEKVISSGLAMPFSGAHFFCSFTFFEEPRSPHEDLFSSHIFLPQWQVTRRGECCLVTVNLPIHSQTQVQTQADQVWTQLQRLQSLRYRRLTPVPGKFAPHFGRSPHAQNPAALDHFKQAVTSILAGIHTQQFEKVVLAHARDIGARSPFSPIRSLQNLRRFYPDCFIFSTGNGRGQSFIGASPERLLSVRNGTLIVDALAGSAPRGRSLSEDAEYANRLLSSDKEQREHQLVVEFIQQQLAQHGIVAQGAESPTLLQLSNIQHLHTPIGGTVSPALNPLELLASLHPTPAVAGIPREAAFHAIQTHEAFERSLYAAPLGWLDQAGNGEFVVGIRSALLSGCQARLYAGAGIVAGSDPEQEAVEIQLKLQALLQAIA
jgi:menaquinone-specific isochorismate synthase